MFGVCDSVRFDSRRDCRTAIGFDSIRLQTRSADSGLVNNRQFCFTRVDECTDVHIHISVTVSLDIVIEDSGTDRAGICTGR